MSTSTAHLQPVTSLAVDPTSNFFLSGSPDAMVHVWALPAILSFSPDTSHSPIHTLSTHRGPIASIVCGHSYGNTSIAISTSEDKSAIVWDYLNGQALRTYLLPELPQAVALDPADRGFYVAYGDGSLQTIDFYDDVQKSTSTDALLDTSLSHRPIQPSTKTRFSAESQKLGAALSLSLSWDGATVLSGHTSGKIAAWDVAKGSYISTLTNLPGSVTNLQLLEPTGFPNAPEPTFKIHTVVKPKQDAGMMSGNALVPTNYSLNMQFTGRLSIPPISATESRASWKSEFEEALTHPSFPTAMLEESLAELETWNSPQKGSAAQAADFLSLSADLNGTGEEAQATSNNAQSEEIKDLKKQLASLQRIQKVTFEQLSELREEKEFFMDKEKKRSQRKQRKAKKKLGLANGGPDADEDVEMSEVSEEDASSDTGEESDHSDEDGSEDDSAGVD